MEKYISKICENCSKDCEMNHEQTMLRNMIVRRCCICNFLTYYKEDGETVIRQEDVFADNPDLLEEKKKLLAELKISKCAKCSKSGNPDDMWCWNLPWCYCSVKALRAEIEGACATPLSAKEHIEELLSR